MVMEKAKDNMTTEEEKAEEKAIMQSAQENTGFLTGSTGISIY